MVQEVILCGGMVTQSQDLSGNYVAACSQQWTVQDYGNFFGLTIDQSQAEQLWSTIAFVLVLAYAIKILARKFRR